MLENESRQSSNIPWVILAGALGMFAISGQKSSTDDNNSTNTNGSKEASKEANPPIVHGKDSLHPLDDFFDLGRGGTQPFTDPSRDKKNDYEQSLIKKKYKRDYLIVTVPDPIDSQFGYMFDELMDAIQRALEMQRYVIDRAWLPWELDKSNPIRTKIMTDWRQLSAVVFPFRGLKDQENASHREDNPGTLLFRSTENGVEALRIVFLVGENPTSGIDKRALTRAIELIDRYPPTDNSRTIPIVGPNYSGSQTSMRMILHDPSNRRFKFHVISGGATGVDQKEFCKGEGDVKFHATVLPNQLVRKAILHYLDKRDQSRASDCDFAYPPRESVAMLTESNTGFGQSAMEKRPNGEGDVSSEEPRYLELNFPLRMASLRSRYEEARRRQDEKLGLPDLDLLVSRISTKPPNQDSIPLQDPATTTSINGEVLQNILSIIRSRKIRYVGITASDVRDQIMLASVIRDRYPAVQLFFLGCDRLLTLPEYSYYLKGTIIGSTYPLIPENQERTDPNLNKKRLVFPSQEAQGCYNAVLAQFGPFDKMIEYGPPQIPDANVAETIWGRPPVWISMIGPNGDLVPLQFFTAPGNDDERGYVWDPQVIAFVTMASQSQPLAAAACSSYFLTNPLPDPQATMPLSFPALAILPLVLLGVLCLIVLYYALRSPASRLFWPTAHDYKDLDSWMDLLHRTICLIALIFLLVPLIELCWIKNSATPWGGFSAFVKKTSLTLVPVSILCLLMLALFTPVVREWLARLQASRGRKPWVYWLRYVLGALLVLGTLVYVWHYAYLGDGLDSWKALFFDRALNFATGVSPLLPLALLSATFFFWGFFQLKKSHLADRFSMPCPYPTGSDAVGAFKGIRDMDKKLRNEFGASRELISESPGAVGLAVVIILGVVAICVYRLSLFLVPTPEGSGWDKVFFLGFVLGYILIAFNLVRFLLFWKRLKKLLHEIALVRMMHAFERLPHKVAVVFGGYLSTRRPRLSQLRIPHHQLGLLLIETDRLVRKLADRQDKDHLSELKLIQKGLTHFKEKDFGSQPESAREEKIMGELSKRFGEMTDSLLQLLPDCWSKHSFQEAFGSDALEERLEKGREKPHKDEPDSGSAATGTGVFQRWVQQAENFIAMQVVIYLSQFLIQLRNLVWSIIICGCLLLLAATSYPFQPERVILMLLLALIGSAIGGILFVLVRINQDEVVSRIMRTTPNKFQFDWGFVSSFFTYIVPMGTVVALQLSGTFRFLLEPLVRLVR